TLASNGHSVDVVTSGMSDLPQLETAGDVNVHRVRCWRRKRHYSTAPELATTLLPTYRTACRLIETHAPDLIHAHFVLPSGIVARALSVKYRIPYVLTAHGSDIPGYNPDRFAMLHRLLQPLWRRVVRDAAAITSPSQFLATLLQQSLDVPVNVIPNGYTPEAHFGCGKSNLVLVVARLLPRKGVQHFIESVAAMTGDWARDWRFVIAGDGPCLAHLKQLAARRGANVQFTGFLDRTSLRRLYEQARILVFPSIRENFPMVLLEGMDAGCAIIATDAEGCAEVVGDAGVVVPRGRSQPIREALIRLMQHPDECEAFSERARQRAELFRWPRIAAQYLQVFETVARPAPLSGPVLGRPVAPSL
ncbi:MAG TPA: glycosyltransferase family 4 protein, partial [Steroidobacteraceae bacterium]